MPFRRCEWIGWTLCATRLELLAESDLLRRKPLLTMNRGPARGSVTATQELLINTLVARAAVACRQMRADDESMMIGLLLALRRLMAIQAVHTLFRMGRHLVLVHYRILKTRVAFRALA